MTSKLLSANRRSSLRRVSDINVLVHDGLELMKCRLRDISLDGAFIETKTFGTDVHLVLDIRSGQNPTHCCLTAKVVRAEGDGAALKFGHLDEQVYTVLLRIVEPSKTKPHLRIVSRS